jgi:PPM family protein phosphatase
MVDPDSSEAPSQSDDPMSQQAPDSTGSSMELASRTDVGQVRSANEDSCDSASDADGSQLLVVADGMGGHRGGATASRVAAAAIREHFDVNGSIQADEMLREAIETANKRIFEMAQADSELEGMGTTVVAFVIDARMRGTVAHVGDSRAYRYRQGQLEPLTTDHSVVAEMQRRGFLSAEEAAAHPRRNEILRSVGVQPEVDVEVARVEIAAGDRFLLCSDGLSGVLNDDEIAAVVQSQAPQQAVDSLVGMANERGGPDNITVQILSVPTSMTQGDPEATAPVELSAIGIEAIESRRRERKQLRRAASAAIVYLAWQFMDRSTSPTPQTSPASPPSEPAPAPAPAGREPGASPDAGEGVPRRGIPR